MIKSMRKFIAGAVVGLAFCGTALAQSTVPAPGSTDTVPGKDTAGSNTPPNTDIGRKGGSLSDKLNFTNGVIHPEGTVDPQMQKPAPATGTMRVIPPPGSPGGDPSVQPK